MCMACEMGFWDMVEALPPETRERFLREENERLKPSFNCDTPDEPQAAADREETKP